MRAANGRSRRAVLRGLEDPVRTLAEAVAEITANLEGEFHSPATSHPRREEIVERLSLLRNVLIEHGGSAVHA